MRAGGIYAIYDDVHINKSEIGLLYICYSDLINKEIVFEPNNGVISDLNCLRVS